MTVRLLVFARVRELLGFGETVLELPAGASARDAWNAVVRSLPALEALAGSTRIARNGTLVDGGAALFDGDEVALLPPAGGG